MEAGSGEAAEVHTRHVEYFAALAEEAEPKLMGAEQAAWLNRLEAEHDNVRAALDWGSAALLRTGAGLRLAGAMSVFGGVRSYFGEGREHIERALAASKMNANRRPRRTNWETRSHSAGESKSTPRGRVF